MSASDPVQPKEAPRQNSIGDEVSSFVHNLDALQTALPVQWMMTAAMGIACQKSFDTFVRKHAEKDPSGSNIKIGPDHFREFNRLFSRLKKAHAATVIVPQTSIVALVSQYDSFLGGLLRCLYRSRPELLMNSEKKLTYSELSHFTDLEQARENILEEEIEDILRKSHSDQFTWMESNFKLKLRVDLPVWPVFVELTQRRNLFVHCAGKVSAQYLVVCDKHKVEYGTRPNIGDTLDVTPEYYARAHACVYEIGTKLAHVLWRKFLPGERENADGNLLSLGFDLLVAGNYDLAATLGTFAIEVIKEHFSEDMRRRMIVNLAQAYKWGGKQAEAMKIIDSLDWSACSPVFNLAVAVLKDDFESAASLMKVVAATELLNKTDYRDWPLFNEFRKSNLFIDAYRSIYGHHLVPIEPSPTDPFFVPFSKLIIRAEAERDSRVDATVTDQTAAVENVSQSQSAPDKTAPNN